MFLSITRVCQLFLHCVDNIPVVGSHRPFCPVPTGADHDLCSRRVALRDALAREEALDRPDGTKEGGGAAGTPRPSEMAATTTLAAMALAAAMAMAVAATTWRAAATAGPPPGRAPVTTSEELQASAAAMPRPAKGQRTHLSTQQRSRAVAPAETEAPVAAASAAGPTVGVPTTAIWAAWRPLPGPFRQQDPWPTQRRPPESPASPPPNQIQSQPPSRVVVGVAVAAVVATGRIGSTRRCVL